MSQNTKTIKINTGLSIPQNPWDNVYWFARMFINRDKYGSIGTDIGVMQKWALGLTTLLKYSPKNIDDEVITRAAVEFTERVLTERWEKSKKMENVKLLCHDLLDKLETVSDVKVLILTCEHILIPINQALNLVPNNDPIFAKAMTSALLKAKGTRGLADIINVWDDLGVQYCLSAKRMEFIKNFSRLRRYLSDKVTLDEIDIILSAFCQEFERRLGQKRKGRAGRGIESVTSFILDYYDIRAEHTPEHFTTGLEIDKWIKCRDGWYIGISCKRTLRERWKQAYTTDMDLLNRHKIKALWHLITFDRDLSDDKLTEMGSHRAILYLPDESERYRSAKKHVGMKEYVHPMTQFITDLRKEF